MAAGYDENVLENPFFKSLKAKFSQIYDDASSKRLTICVPRYGSLARQVPNLVDIENHILTPIPGSEKTFQTLNNREVIVDGHLLRTSSGFHDVRQVEILFEETFFNVNKESFSILCIERPLEGGNSFTTNTLGPLESIHDCIEFLWPPHGGPYTSRREIDHFLDSFLQTWIVEFSHLGSLMASVISLLNRLFPMLMKESHLRKTAKSGNFIETTKLALETYVIHNLHGKLFPALCSLSSQKDAAFNKVVRNLADIQLKDLGIKPSLRNNIPAARRTLSSLNTYTTPLEKFNCLKKTIVGVTMTKENKDQGFSSRVFTVTADDLLPVLECLVIKSDLPNWMANLTFLHNFRFSNRTYDEFRFYMSSFEAAVEYIRKSYRHDTRLDVSLKPKFLESTASSFQDMLSRRNSMEKKYDIPSRGPSPLELFFQHVMNCHDSEVKRILNKSSTLVKLCHPLCSCDQCESVLDRHRNDPEAVTVFSRDDLGRTALHIAADYGHTSTIHLLVQKGSVVNTTDYHGSAPLHLACQRGHQQATMLLLHYCADILAQDNDGNASIHLCCSNGHEECAKALVFFDLHNNDLDLNAINKHGDTPLHLAARWGFENIVKLLLDNGASTDVVNKKNETPMNCANNTQIKRLLSKEESTQYIIIEESVIPSRVRAYTTSSDNEKYKRVEANQRQVEGFLKTVIEGDIRMVYHKLGLEDEWDLEEESDESSSLSPKDFTHDLCHPLCQCEKCRKYHQDVTPSPYRKVDINSQGVDGKTALHYASFYGYEHIASVLLKNGAMVSLTDYNRKCMPLHLACQYNHPKIVTMLLQHHADVDCQDARRNTPLHYCCQNGNIEPAEILIKNGATLSIVNERGNTALHDAARWSSVQLVRLLLKNKAPLTIRNLHGLTPLHMAKHDEIVKILNEGTIAEKQNTNHQKEFVSPQTTKPRNVENFDVMSTSLDEPANFTDDTTGGSQVSFFDSSSPEVFVSTTQSESSISSIPFPRKLPEILNGDDDDIDPKLLAIERLKHVLDGIKYFDRKAGLRRTETMDRSKPLVSPLLKLQFSIEHFDPTRLRKVSEVECDQVKNTSSFEKETRNFVENGNKIDSLYMNE